MFAARIIAAAIVGIGLAVPALAAGDPAQSELISMLVRQRDDAMVRASQIAAALAGAQDELAKAKDEIDTLKKAKTK